MANVPGLADPAVNPGSNSAGARLNALADYNILDTPVEPAFEDITRIAAIALGVPIALVSLVAEHRQWFKSEIGIGCRETPIDSSICAYAIRRGQLFEIPDLTLDPRFVQNPLVTADPQARFYAGAVLRTSDGTSLGTVCVLDKKPRRLTEPQREVLLGLARQVMAQLELRRALRRAEIFHQGQTRLMAIAGHDLRQPLQVIASSIELSLRRTDAPALIKSLGVARQAVKQLGAGLNDLASAAAKAGGIGAPTVLEQFQLSDLFAELSPSWKEQADLKNLRLDVVQSSASVLSDRRLLGSILGNLVGNAIKYTRTGRVLVGCRRRGGGKLELCVIDTGAGIAEKDRSTIFTPFKQIDPASEGLGLGLTLVKHAADFLQYEIGVSSIPGRGSRFSVLLPQNRGADKRRNME